MILTPSLKQVTHFTENVKLLQPINHILCLNCTFLSFPVCLALDPESATTWRMNNASFFELEFYRLVNLNYINESCKQYPNLSRNGFIGLLVLFENRLVEIEITFALKGINLQSVRSHEQPDCYTFFVKVRSNLGS